MAPKQKSNKKKGKVPTIEEIEKKILSDLEQSKSINTALNKISQEANRYLPTSGANTFYSQMQNMLQTAFTYIGDDGVQGILGQCIVSAVGHVSSWNYDRAKQSFVDVLREQMNHIVDTVAECIRNRTDHFSVSKRDSFQIGLSISISENLKNRFLASLDDNIFIELLSWEDRCEAVEQFKKYIENELCQRKYAITKQFFNTEFDELIKISDILTLDNPSFENLTNFYINQSNKNEFLKRFYSKLGGKTNLDTEHIQIELRILFNENLISDIERLKHCMERAVALAYERLTVLNVIDLCNNRSRYKEKEWYEDLAMAISSSDAGKDLRKLTEALHSALPNYSPVVDYVNSAKGNNGSSGNAPVVTSPQAKQLVTRFLYDVNYLRNHWSLAESQNAADNSLASDLGQLSFSPEPSESRSAEAALEEGLQRPSFTTSYQPYQPGHGRGAGSFGGR
jgi:hypothetical protein